MSSHGMTDILLAALVFYLLVKLHCCCIALRVVMIGLNLPRVRNKEFMNLDVNKFG